MRVTVRAILETEFKQDPALARIMNHRLERAAKELQNIHLSPLLDVRTSPDFLMVYICYNAKYKIRYRIVNQVTAAVEYFVADRCGRLGYILWKDMLSVLAVNYRVEI